MGQHKTNPTAIKAKNGEIEPKKPGMSKRQQKRLIQAELYKRTGASRLLAGMQTFY